MPRYMPRYMPRRSSCPPGVFCIENVTILLLCSVFLIVGWFLCKHTSAAPANHTNSSPASAIFMQAPANNKGRGEDVFFDMYKPPLRDDNCGLATNDIRGEVRINVPTQECGDSPYRQVGILTRQGQGQNSETILPLLGRPLFRRRDKWNFYTLNDKNNMIKLPIRVKGRDALDENGCDNVYTGDTVYVEGYNEVFKVTAYNNQIMRYLPTL
jgi:hypothetical protein